jgi:translation initiation factor eIF-2B subunit alpha
VPCLKRLIVKISLEILTHSYSRVVMETLLLAHKRSKRLSGWLHFVVHVAEYIVDHIAVFVTEARPRGLGFVSAMIDLVNF